MHVPDFHAPSSEAGMHPRLFAAQEEVLDARRRIREQPGCREAFNELEAQAEKDAAVKLQPLDRSWWDAVRDRPWEETYPLIFEKTWLQPSRMPVPMARLARMHLLTGEAPSASHARRLMSHLCQYSFEFEHYDVGMNYSVWGILALEAYDILFEQLAEGERAAADAFFTRMGRAVLANDELWVARGIGGGINNHLAWHKMMLGLLGAFYGVGSLVEFALHGPRGIAELLERGLVDDGLWCESSLNYHFAAIVPMVHLAEVLRRARFGEDLFSAIFANGRTLKQSLDAMFDTLFPDGMIPPIGDAYGRWETLAEQALYEQALPVYGDPRYAWLLARAKERSPEAVLRGARLEPRRAPAIGSRLFPEHGYVFLRNRKDDEYWDGPSWCAFLTYDRSGVHCNADKLALMLYGRGKLLLPDVEARPTVAHAFSAQVQQEINRHTISHNTVLVDGQNQSPAGELLDLLEYRDLPSEKRGTVADLEGRLYRGARQQRTVCVTDEYLLDVFQVSADSTRTIEWLLHGPADTSGERSSLSFAPSSARREGPWKWIRDYRSAECSGAWWVEWEAGGVSVRATLAGGPATTVTRCGYPTTDVEGCPIMPMLVVSRRARAACFVAAYQASEGQAAGLEVSVGAVHDGAFPVAVRVAGSSRTHLVRLLSGIPDRRNS